VVAYFITDATGPVGRPLVDQLLTAHQDDIYVGVRATSRPGLEELPRRWRDGGRVHGVVVAPSAPALGVDPAWVAAHAGTIEHVFHLPAHPKPEWTDELAVGGTQQALVFAAELGEPTFHHLSSIGVAGDHTGPYDETMFDVGQRLPAPYHRTAFEAERAVRGQSSVRWRVYRAAVVVGSSKTGAIACGDGPYSMFPLLRRLRDTLPQWAPLVGLDLGDTNIVPVDYVVEATDHLAHQPGLDGRTFHLVNPAPQPTIEVINAFAAAAQAPRFAVPVDRRTTSLIPTWGLPTRAARAVVTSGPGRFALRQTLGRFGFPPQVLDVLSLPTTFASRQTERELAGSGIGCPDLESYAPLLWDYWEQRLDRATAKDAALRRALEGRAVVITESPAGIGTTLALKVAQAGGVPVLVASNPEILAAVASDIEDAGGVAYTYVCDLSDLATIDALAEQVTEDHDAVRVVVVTDAGPVAQLSRLGAIRLVRGLSVALHAAGTGHVVTITSVGAQSDLPWSSDLLGDGIRFSTVRLDASPGLSAARAADLVLREVKEEAPNTVVRMLRSIRR